MNLLRKHWIIAAGVGAGVVWLVFGNQIAAALGMGGADAGAGSSNATSPEVRSGAGQDQTKPTSSNGAKGGPK